MFKIQADRRGGPEPAPANRSVPGRTRRHVLLCPRILALLVLNLTACSGGRSDPVIVGGSPTSELKGELTIEPASFALSEGEGISLRAKLGSAQVGASQITWTVSPSDIATVDGNGHFRALKHGEATVTARITSSQATSLATVLATPRRIEAISSQPQAGIVGRTLADSLGVRAVSNDGTPVPGVDIAFEILSGSGVLSHTNRATDAEGVARVTWTLGTVAGDQRIRAWGTNLGELNFQADALPDYDSATVVALTGEDQEGVVTTVLPEELRAQVTDQFGNVLSGLAVEWAFADGGGFFGSSANTGDPAPVLTSVADDQGVTQVFWKLGTVAGEQEAVCAPPSPGGTGVAGNLGGNASNGGAPQGKPRGKKWKAVARAADPNEVVVVPELTWTLVGGSEALTAAVVDSYGNVITGYAFDWKADNSGVVTVDNKGNVVGLRAGTGQVTAESSTLNLTGRGAVVVETKVPGSMNRGSGNGQKGAVAEQLPNPVQVMVLDQAGEPVPGIEVRWTVGQSPSPEGGQAGAPNMSSGQIDVPVTITDLNGLAETAWTLGTLAGTQTLQASVEGLASVEFTAEAAPGAVVTVSVDPSTASIEIGQTKQFAFSARDGHGNAVPSTLVQWQSSDQGLATVGSSGLATGLSQGSVEVIATGGGVSGSGTLRVSPPVEAVTSIVVSPSTVTLEGLDQSVSLTATAYDSFGEVVPDAIIEWTSLTSAVAKVSQGGVVTSRALGLALIVASASCCAASDTVVTQVNEAVIAPPPTLTQLVLSPASVTLETGSTQQFAVTGTWSNGSIATPAVTWSATGGTISSAGLFTAGPTAGIFRVIATQQGGPKADTSVVTIPSVPPTLPVACQDTPHVRLVDVSTNAELTAALANARPGDLIVVEDGTYVPEEGYGSFKARNISGTPTDPITLCGSSLAVIDGGTLTGRMGLLVENANYWTFAGFTITRGLDGFHANNSSHNTLSGLTIRGTGNAGIRLRNFSRNNVIRNNVITDTGLNVAEYGEGIYVGTAKNQLCLFSGCAPDASDSTLIEGNNIGPNVRAEHIDIKGSANDGEIRNNVFDGRGMVMVQPAGPSSNIVKSVSWVLIHGNGYLVHHNTGSEAILHGFWVPSPGEPGWGHNNVFWANTADLNGADWGFYISAETTGNVVRCDNDVRNATKGLANVACRN